MLKQLLFEFIKLGIYSCFLLFLGQLVIKKKTLKSKLLLSLFLCLFMLLLDGYLLVSNQIANFPHLVLAHIPVLFLVGPTLYLYHTYYITNTNQFHKKHLFHFFPTILIFVTLIPFYFQTGEIKRELFFKTIVQKKITFPIVLSITATFANFAYILLILKKSSFLINKELWVKERTSRYLLYIVFLSLIADLTMFGTFVFKNFHFIFVSLVVLVIILLSIYLLSWRHPDFLQDLNRIVEEQKKKYAKSHIDSLNIQSIKEKLENYMKKEKPYLEEDVSLESIAINLKLTTHQFSQFLNQILQKSFYQYINEFRIQEAINILQNDPKISILNIAYQVGFNSKSSFNSTFKKITGKTPSEYRKIYLKKV